MDVEDSCDAVGCGGACRMGAMGAESQEEVGERIGTAVEGAGGRGGNLSCMNKVKAVKVGQNVGCLLKKAMELGKCNGGAMEQSSLVCAGMHLEGTLL